MRHYEKIPVSDIFAITETDHSAKLNLEEFQVRYNYFKSLRTPPLDGLYFYKEILSPFAIFLIERYLCLKHGTKYSCEYHHFQREDYFELVEFIEAQMSK